MDNNGLTHFDGEGNAIMVDVSGKDVTSRTATAKGSIHVNREVMDAVVNHTAKKVTCWVWPVWPASWQ